jgi:glycosyltransferase involved in cell wall biosynthesis
MRVLLYNFRQPEEPGTGGVGVYCNNLAKALAGQGHQVITMSAGDRYSLLRQQPRVEFSRDAFDRAVVLNSPVVAPAVYSFGDPDSFLESTALDFVPDLLAERYGAIDVFHFQNIEGLTRSFFHRLRARFPDARLVYSVHNYHLMCSRVTLWYQDRTACEDYHHGVACTMCRAETFHLPTVRAGRRLLWAEATYPLATRLAAPAVQALKAARRTLNRARNRKAGVESDRPVAGPTSTARAYHDFRHANIALCQDVFDQVLAVSDRTRQVMIRCGVAPEKLAVSYIGTAHKQNYLTSTKITDVGTGLHLGYIGYMTRDKGFYFLLECLERMPAALATQVSVTIAARNTDADAHARVEALGARFRAVRYFDGYTHANLDQVLDGVNLGVIPVLWEDNLPQTSIELVSRGIPVLTSDRGGAQEIAHNPPFIFAAGDHDAFIERCRLVAAGEVPLAAFWTGDMRIFSMAEHLADLARYYRPEPAAVA